MGSVLHTGACLRDQFQLDKKCLYWSIVSGFCLWVGLGFFCFVFFFSKQNLQIILIYLKRNYYTLSVKVACLGCHIALEAPVRIQDLSIRCAFFLWGKWISFSSFTNLLI